VTLLSAIGGSLNALIHLPALAAELGFSLDWDDVAAITSRTPVLCGIVPNGDLTCVDLHYAGGIPAVMKELKDMLHGECLTVAGKTLGQILEETPEGDRAVIRTVEEPLAKADGIQVLYGNLAPNGALVKTSAVPKDVWVFQGTAKVFEGEDACYAAFREKKIKEGDAVIVRYEGPKGGPGMKELHRITEIIKGIPNTAVITDGRFSGASGGLSIGYLCPEAAEGGPIALVQDGDRILVDLPKGILTLDVPEEELARRKAQWALPDKQEEKGLLGRYSRMVGTAREGAIFR
jgi:dihydroxy-acid dehydratase